MYCRDILNGLFWVNPQEVFKEGVSVLLIMGLLNKNVIFLSQETQCVCQYCSVLSRTEN